MTEKEKQILNKFYEMLRTNRVIAEAYLNYEYANVCERLVNSDSEKERGKAQYLKYLLSVIK